MAANDKEWPVIFDRLVYIATHFTYHHAQQKFGVKVFDTLTKITGRQELYSLELSERSIRAMRSSELEDNVGFIESMFGMESKLTRDEFVEKLQSS